MSEIGYRIVFGTVAGLILISLYFDVLIVYSWYAIRGNQKIPIKKLLCDYISGIAICDILTYFVYFTYFVSATFQKPDKPIISNIDNGWCIFGFFRSIF